MPALNRISVDIGGTFTDVVLSSAGGLHSRKVLTTPQAPEQGMLEGIRQVLADAALDPAAVGMIIHGTTLATNALIERKGARTAFLTNAGFRDVLATGDEKRFEHYDLDLEKPIPLVPRPWRLTVPGRMAADGRELTPLDLHALESVVDTLRTQAIEALAIGFLHAYANPSHERAAADFIQARLPQLALSLSSEVCPEIREYERFSTTVANAYVQPLMARYLKALAQRLNDLGFNCPLYLVTSGGGLTTLNTAARLPIRLVESGPAGGATLAAAISRQMQLSQTLSFDMGGTTAKICFITDGQAEQSRRFEVARAWRNLKGSGWPVRIPVTEMVEIGAGGGSLARIDRMGRIAVGPDSAGAEPGPVCYGRGGAMPTVTDANLTLGRLDPDGFAGGRLRLQADRAADALAEQIATPQALSLAWAACGIVEMVEENMASAARVHAIERGKETAPCTLIAFGGAAPLHAVSMARRLGMRRVIIPSGAGVGSALGFLKAPLAFDAVRSWRHTLTDLPLDQLNRLLEQLESEATDIVRGGTPEAQLQVRRLVDTRYVGQGHELSIELPNEIVSTATLEQLKERFESRYEAQYGLRIAGVDLEFLTWTVSVAANASVGGIDAALVSSTTAAPVSASIPASAVTSTPTRSVFDPSVGDWMAYEVYDRAALTDTSSINGPALIVEEQTTTLVPAGWSLCQHATGHLVIETRGQHDTP
ncbi:MAG: hypothetical protein RI906_1781 [Pseudomonadota bacterium]|jgi:N-methylhydantoinase A